MLFIESFGYHIKSKHDVFSDGTEQKCLHFSELSFWDGISKEKNCHFIATQWAMHDFSFTLSYAIVFTF